METIDFLLNRRSTPAILLQEPAPNEQAIATILSVAVTAPDHGALRPWRFLMIRDQARNKLGQIMVKAAAQQQPTLGEAQLEAIQKKPLRSPLLMVVIAKLQDHPNVPQQEQMLSAGITAYNIELAACALGFGAIWVTGPYATDEYVTQSLGLSKNEQIVGFIHLGTPDPKAPAAWEKAIARPNPAELCQEWA